MGEQRRVRGGGALTDQGLRGKWTGDRLATERLGRGSGVLAAKITKTGTALYYCYTTSAGARRYWPIGRYDPAGKSGLKLADAREAAREHAKVYRGLADRDLHGHYDRVERERVARAKAEQAAREILEAERRREQELGQSATLGALLRGYVRHLERAGKQSAADVRRSFTRNVYGLFPELCEKPAAAVSTTELKEVIRRPWEAGKGRDAAKLRAHVRAAYALAIKAATDPTSPEGFDAMRIESNPAASLASMSQFNRARSRVLTAEELRCYLRCVGELADGPIRDALLAAVELGGQRPLQLLRVTPADVDLDAATVRLFDSKGRRQTPRTHVLPLLPRSREIFERRAKAHTEGPYLFGGKRRVNEGTVSTAVREISAAMVAAGEAKESFRLSDIRRTCETMMAKLAIPAEVRAQIQSHGLGGVQNRHYNFHNYEPEKRAALEVWEARLAAIEAGELVQSNVVVGIFGKQQGGAA